MQGKFLTGKYENIELERKIQKTKIDPWMEKFGKSLDLRKAKNKKELRYKSIEPNPKNFAYRMVDVGSKDDGEKFGEKNDSDYTKLHPRAYEDLLELQSELQDLLQKELHLSEDYTPTLVVTSIARDEAYAKKYLANASENSSHFYQVAFDLRTYPGEITNIKTGERIVLSGKDAVLYKMALTKILRKMHDEGIIFAIPEGNPPHFHVTSRMGTDPNWKVNSYNVKLQSNAK